MSHCVLIVDDEFLVRALASEMLESIGCEVTEAHDGTHALAALERNPRIGVLISDINMPGMDGYELADKSETPAAGSTRVADNGRARRRPRLPNSP
jgi:CheY-like chemotaxis protein